MDQTSSAEWLLKTTALNEELSNMHSGQPYVHKQTEKSFAVCFMAQSSLDNSGCPCSPFVVRLRVSVSQFWITIPALCSLLPANLFFSVKLENTIFRVIYIKKALICSELNKSLLNK